MSRAIKAVNTFQSYQEERQQQREICLRNILATARKSRARFKFVTDLAKMAAVHVSQVEGGECHPATLLRNKRYKALLLSYMAEGSNEGGKGAGLNVIDSPTKKTELTLSQLETSNLRSENQRLKRHLAALESIVAAKGFNDSFSVSGNGSNRESQSHQRDEFKEKYVTTCQVVALLLDSMQEFVAADGENMEIIDRTRRRDNVIVDERLARPFFEWLKANPKFR